MLLVLLAALFVAFGLDESARHRLWGDGQGEGRGVLVTALRRTIAHIFRRKCACPVRSLEFWLGVTNGLEAVQMMRF